ncbi:MAG: FapA family protein [Glaciecola sp.]|nr:FapA family protein [Glaciecola sp.]MDG2100188.1 FapA family protein [Glaciecola sp.]
MQGVKFQFNEQEQHVTASVDVSKLSNPIDTEQLVTVFLTTPHQQYFPLTDELGAFIDNINIDLQATKAVEHETTFAIIKDAQLILTVADDKMSARLEVISAYGGKIPTTSEAIAFCHEKLVTRGISHKRIKVLLERAETLSTGKSVSEVIAHGLPVKEGKASECIHLVKNALERILQPKIGDKDIADMRDLGDIFTVTKDTPILRYRESTNGRHGFTVENKPIKAKAGKSKPLKLEDGVRINERDTNLVIADRDGMPKFDGFKVRVHEVYVSNGVNVGTGNIDYQGAVIVNGDVADRMKIIAKGDITVNGFVESAYLETKGDIIITQGAAGQTVDNNTDPNCVIRAQGNVCIENAQGLNIVCGGDLIVHKQLAFSKIVCKGNIFVGKDDKADGILIGCQIAARGEITAGVIGATSGSGISIDFTKEYNDVFLAASSLNTQYNTLQKTYAQHQDALLRVKGKKLPPELSSKINVLEKAVIKEKQLLNWIKERITENSQQQQESEQFLTIKATHTLHSGVNVIVNKSTWKSKQQFGPSKVFFANSKWEIVPIT